MITFYFVLFSADDADTDVAVTAAAVAHLVRLIYIWIAKMCPRIWASDEKQKRI